MSRCSLAGIFLTLPLIFSANTFAADNNMAKMKELYEKAAAAADGGNYELAVNLYEQMIEINPDFAPAYNGLGLTYRYLGESDPQEIVWLFKTATEIDPKFAQAYDNLGKTYYGMGDFENAERSCKKALDLNPDMLSAQLSLGWIYLLGKSQPRTAVKYFQEAAKKKDVPYAYYGLGIAHFMAGEKPMVLEIITKLKQMQKDDLAKNLESMIRDKYYVPPGMPNAPLVKTRPQHGKLIRSGEGESESYVSESQESLEPYSAVRLKAKLVNKLHPDNSPALGQSYNDSSQYSGPNTTKERIRQLQRLRATQASTGVTTTSTSTPKPAASTTPVY